MSHLTDLTLNAYLDSDLDPTARREADEHLATCPECAARLATLRLLVAEIESLPELPLQRDLSRLVVAALQPKRVPINRPVLSLTARLAFALQAVGALVALALAIPLAMQLIAPFDLTSSFQSLTADFQLSGDIFNLQSLISNIESLTSNFQFPTAGANLQLPTFEITTLILSAIGITLLWFIGNGLLLRLNSPNSLKPQIK